MPSSLSPLFIRGAKPVGFGPDTPSGPVDVLIGADGRIAAAGANLAAPEGAETVDAGGAWLSPGWVDLHTHIYHGGTDISVRPTQCGAAHGVTTLVDAGSAGEANFEGFREFVIDRARERILAFLNIGSIGLVACNRVSELIDIRSIDVERTLACIEANRDVIRGIKVRASHVILGSWGMTPVKLAKKVAKIAKLPLMVHVGEPPPLVEEIFEILTPGDVVTHCFNGKPGGNILEDEDLFRLAERLSKEGIRLDVGHGAASFSFKVAEASIRRGLLPFSISTDLHRRNIEGPVWDMATTMSKLLSLGMPFDAVIEAATLAPMAAIGLATDGLLSPGARAELTLFRTDEIELTIPDSDGVTTTVRQLLRPTATIIGRDVIEARRAFDPAAFDPGAPGTDGR